VGGEAVPAAGFAVVLPRSIEPSQYHARAYPLGGNPQEIATARRRARALFKRWRVPAALLQDAVLAVSELVSNAVRHGREPMEMCLTNAGKALRIAVRDHNPALPRMRHPVPGDPTGGQGLRLIASLSEAWGARSHQDGSKTVWCQLPLTP
jgi:anti-sigma regulatory factor (Ser/Thr protein kinase)